MLMSCQRANTFTKIFIQLRTMSNYVCLAIYELRHTFFKTAEEYTESSKENSLVLKILISGST